MPQTDFEERLRGALEADASRAVGRYPDRPAKTASTASRRPSRSWRRPALAVPAGLVATGAIVLVAVALLDGWGSPKTALAATPPMLVFESDGAPTVQPLLADLADRAARLPAIEPPRHGYVYLVQQSWYLAVAVGKSVAAKVVPTVTDTWTSANGPQLTIATPAPPLSPGRSTGAEQSQTLHGATLGRPVRQRLSPGDVRPFGSLSGLSSRPRVLFGQLADPADVGWSRSLSDPVAVGHAMDSLVQYLNYSTATRTFLRTLYRMLAFVPGVSDAGRVTDRAGRRGIAIAVPTGGKGYWHSFRLIVDPSTGQLLAVEDIQLARSAVPIKTPFVYSYVVYLQSGIATRVGTRP